MKGYDYITELVHLPSIPKDSKETKNKLRCLLELERRFERYKSVELPYSKRRTRLVKMYWAFRKIEAGTSA